MHTLATPKRVRRWSHHQDNRACWPRRWPSYPTTEGPICSLPRRRCSSIFLRTIEVCTRQRLEARAQPPHQCCYDATRVATQNNQCYSSQGRSCLQVSKPRAYGEAGQKMPLKSLARHREREVESSKCCHYRAGTKLAVPRRIDVLPRRKSACPCAAVERRACSNVIKPPRKGERS